MALTVTYRDIASLHPDPQNTRTHSDGQVAQIADSIREFGFTNPVLITADGQLIAGEGRWLGAQLYNHRIDQSVAEYVGRELLKQIPCIVLDGLSDRQRRAYVIADNRIAQNSGWDWSKLADETSALVELDFDVDVLGFSDDELSAILSDGGVFPDGGPKPPKRAKPATDDRGDEPASKGVSRIMHTCPNCGTTFN